MNWDFSDIEDVGSAASVAFGTVACEVVQADLVLEASVHLHVCEVAIIFIPATSFSAVVEVADLL